MKHWDRWAQLNETVGAALELGAGRTGGLSLWLASKGFDVVCSDYGGVNEGARRLHARHAFGSGIRYEAVDARFIPHAGTFDVVAYKSMLGGIVMDGSLDTARQVIQGIHHALKPGGVLLFAENLVSTRIHHALRKRFGSGRHDWRYFSVEELSELHSSFSEFRYVTVGFLGCFGRTERQRRLLGAIDRYLLRFVVPREWRYVMIAMARK